MGSIRLTRAQWARLQLLEDDPTARVVNHLDGCPVVEHSGQDKRNKHSSGIIRLSTIAASGRLRRVGKEQRQLLKFKKTRI